MSALVSYNEIVRRHFADPRHAGELRGEFERTLIADVSDSDKGAHVVMAAGVCDDIIAGMAFRVWGCPHLIAALELACNLLVSEPAASLENYELADITQELSVPAEKTGRILLLEDALTTLWAQYGSAET